MEHDLLICSSRRFIRMECLIVKFRLEEEKGRKKEEILREKEFHWLIIFSLFEDTD